MCTDEVNHSPLDRANSLHASQYEFLLAFNQYEDIFQAKVSKNSLVDNVIIISLTCLNILKFVRTIFGYIEVIRVYNPNSDASFHKAWRALR